MDILILALVPLLFLLLAAGLLIVSQLSGFIQFARHLARERADAAVIVAFMARAKLAQRELARRAAALESLSRRLKLNNEELARLNALKSKFLSMAVHDLRTPLASIEGYGRLLQSRGGLANEQERSVKNILTASGQIDRLLADLVDLAVIEAGKLRVERTATNVRELVADAAAQAAVLAAAKGVAFSVPEPPPAAPLVADRFRLARLLSNLLSNAVKFTPAGGKVELRARVSAGSVTFSVKDSGPGIHPSERRRIFEKFYQSPLAKAPRGSGWGLGLSIADEIARAHGGEIGVESAGLGRGATFWARIPLAPARDTRPSGLKRLPAAATIVLLLACGTARAQTIPLEEKARFEQTLEQRADDLLLRILGPGRAKVVIDATLDFNRIERIETKDAPAAAKAASSYLWNDRSEAQSPELLPGVPGPGSGAVPSAPAAGPKSYERRQIYPDDFLKRLSVTLILDRAVAPERADEARAVVADLLGLNEARGDALTLVRASFAPAWKTIWYAPESARLIAKYGLATLLCLLTLIVVATSFSKLSGAMHAMARTEMQQLGLDLKGDLASASDQAALGGPPGVPALEGDSGASQTPEAVLSPAEVVFNVRLEQVDSLCEMVREEDAANVALLASHLKPEIRRALLSGLPRDVTAKVIGHLGRVRFVEPDLILKLKEELEWRLAGAVGGLAAAAELIESAELGERSALLTRLKASDPSLAAQLRQRVFFLEDLEAMSAEEWSHLLSGARHEDWALVLAEAPEGVRTSFREKVGEKARRVIEELMASGSPADVDSRRQALRRVAEALSALSREGRLRKEEA